MYLLFIDNQIYLRSYASLIRLAILDAPNGKATLSEIYNWIRDKFQYYKSSGSGWKVRMFRL